MVLIAFKTEDVKSFQFQPQIYIRNQELKLFKVRELKILMGVITVMREISKRQCMIQPINGNISHA